MQNKKDVVLTIGGESREDINTPLIPKEGSLNDEQIEDFGCFYSIKRFFGWTVGKEKRKLYLNGVSQPRYFAANKINNQKYSILAFVPLVLYHEFKFFFNLFFLMIALSQLVPFLRVGFLFTYLAPLCFVLFITMCKEAFDDIQRYRRDQDQNRTKLDVLGHNGFRTQYAQDLKVGQIIKVYQNQRLPADLLLLYTTEKNGSVFIRTDQLDGETDWKHRKAVPITQKTNPPETIFHLDGYVYAMPPNDQIYDFKGYFQHIVGGDREPLSLENTLWANTVLASSGYILGMVLYTGKETRSQMNSKMPRSKVGLLDQEINFLSKALFVLMLIISAIIIVLDGFVGSWYFKYFRFVLLLASIIPISLRVNLDMAKIYYSYQISHDKMIEGTIARNSTIPEELGRIQFLLSDKTGTLTQNDMIFKKIAMEYATFSVETMDDLGELLKQSCKESSGPCGDLQQSFMMDEQLQQQFDFKKQKKKQPDNNRKKRRDQHFIVRDMLLALALCHNVTPTYPDASNPQYKEYQASSPDEVALVKFSDSLNMKLIEREEQYVRIENANGDSEEYDILANFPFSSESKRMGIVLRHRNTSKIIFYVKGAENVMEKKVKPNQRASLSESCESLAMEGLRTLVISQKLISDKQYEEFDKNYKRARASMANREEMIIRAIEGLEGEDMEYLGVTGVEDKLQDDVLQTIETLRSAGIQIWMLTGDKIETAKCIAISAGFKQKRETIFEMKDLNSTIDIMQKLNEFEKKITSSLLIIDGTTLSVVLASPSLEERFFNVAKDAPSVCICRCSPTQKAVVATMIKKYSKKRIACVGDGGNDVAMIQVADVGIGIVGKEGMQASLAADFSIIQFNYLRHLVLWHGRLSYKRSAVLSQFVIHRGLIISIIQAIFSIIFYYVSIPIYNGYLMMGYTTIYTAFPVFSLVLDEDVDLESVMNFPPLYKSLQKGRSLNFKTFMIWVWKSIYQGCVIMISTIVLFNDSFVNIVSITFSALIFIELLNIFTEVNKIKFKMVVSIVLTVITYIASIALFRNYFDVSYITTEFILKVIVITSICWLPIHLLKKIIEKIDPSEEAKVKKS